MFHQRFSGVADADFQTRAAAIAMRRHGSSRIDAAAMLRYLVLCFLATMLFLSTAACTTPQERSGRNPRPFNSPAAWETNPYGDMFRN